MRSWALFRAATLAIGLLMPGLAGAYELPIPSNPEAGAAPYGVVILAASGFEVSCQLDTSASIAHLYVRNSSRVPLAPGTRIMWGAQPGSLSGVALVGPNGLPPGEWQYVGGYVGVQSCNASVVN